MQLRSSVAVAVVKAGSYSSDLIPSLVTSICRGFSPKKKRKEGRKGGRKRKKEKKVYSFLLSFPIKPH